MLGRIKNNEIKIARIGLGYVGFASAVVPDATHREFTEFDPAPYRKENTVVFGIKSQRPRNRIDGRL